jgi:tetratricopeptide (TPR) repeat protein
MLKEQKSRLWIAAVLCALLVALVWFVFGQTVSYEFVNYDDDTYVYKNPVVSNGLTWHGLQVAFTGTLSSNWHPLTVISHMLDCQLFGLNPAGPHLVNVFLHTIAVLLLFLVLWQMTAEPSPDGADAIWRSAFVAAVFAIHPLRVESVAWISERKDVLSGVLFMLALGAYASYTRRPTITRYLIVSIIYALGLMAKPMLVTLPFVLLLLDYWPLRRLSPDRKSLVSAIREKIPLFVLAAASSIVTVIVQTQSMPLMKEFPFSTRLANAFLSYLTYVRQMFWPTKLAAFYPYVSHQRFAVFLAVVFVLAVSVSAVVAKRKYPYVATGWYWYVIMLLPVIGLVQVGIQAHADRYTYLPQIGLYVAMTWLVAELSKRLPQRPVFLGGGAAIVLALLAWNAHRQTQYWHDSGVLWQHALAVTENNYVAHADLASVLQNSDEVLAHLQEALRLRPEYAVTHSRLGLLYGGRGEFDKATEQFRQALAIEPDNAESLGGLGNVLRMTGETHEAAGYFERALKTDPESTISLSGLAWILATCPDASLRDGRRAVELARKAVELSRHEDPIALGTLACAYAEAGEFDQAIVLARQALDLARARSNSALASELTLEIDLYQTGLPLRDRSLTH